MNKIIESSVEEILTVPQTDLEWQEHDLDAEETDMTNAIFDAHDDPC
jgi:hypothetical protein